MPHSVVFRLSLLSSHSEGEIGSASHKEGNEPSFARLTILYSRPRLIPKPIYCGAGPAALDGNCGPAAPNGNGGRSYQANKHRWSRRRGQGETATGAEDFRRTQRGCEPGSPSSLTSVPLHRHSTWPSQPFQLGLALCSQLSSWRQDSQIALGGVAFRRHIPIH
eukprot:g73821.t1